MVVVEEEEGGGVVVEVGLLGWEEALLLAAARGTDRIPGTCMAYVLVLLLCALPVEDRIGTVDSP
jgi:hypothetical protein